MYQWIYDRRSTLTFIFYMVVLYIGTSILCRFVDNILAMIIMVALWFTVGTRYAMPATEKLFPKPKGLN